MRQLRFLFLMQFALAMLFTTDGRAQDPGQVARYLEEMQDLLGQVVELSDAAAAAANVEAVKMGADQVFELIWGVSSGLTEEAGGVAVHGWKTRWQVDNGHFDEAFAERYGVVPPKIQDPALLGLMGRGRALRLLLHQRLQHGGLSDTQKNQIEKGIASLNNVIGWVKMDDGVTKGERQPRVDLTREWDAPSEFWLSTADTGWLPEVYSQAVNILKVDYQGDLEEAQAHARAMHALAIRCVEGLDANEDGTIAPVQMEGGFAAAYAQIMSASP